MTIENEPLITIPKWLYDVLLDSAEVEWRSLENLEPYYGKYRKDKSLYEALVFTGRIKEE